MKMFDPELEVPSLELCKRLKELGFPQDGGGWYWIQVDGKWQLVLLLVATEEYLQQDVIYRIKAPTMWELNNYLWRIEEEMNGKLILGKDLYQNKFYCEIQSKNRDYQIAIKRWEDEKEVELRSKVVIWAWENGYVNFERR